MKTPFFISIITLFLSAFFYVHAAGEYTLSGTTYAKVGEQGCWKITGPASSLETFWHGTKNGSPDTTDLLGPETNSSDMCYTFKNNDIGYFVRYAHVREGSNHEAHTTNYISINIDPDYSSPSNASSGAGANLSSSGSSNLGSSAGGTSVTTNVATQSNTSQNTASQQSASNSNTNNTFSYPTPIISMLSNPTAIKAGESTTIFWNTKDAWFCTASDGWGGSKSLVGTETFMLGKTTRFQFLCGNPSANVSAEVTVPVSGSLNNFSNSSFTPSIPPILNFVVSCATSPLVGEAGNNIIFAAGSSGGIPPVTYHWNGDVYGTGQIQNVSFGIPGTKNVWVTAEDAAGKTAGGACSTNIQSVAVSRVSSNATAAKVIAKNTRFLTKTKTSSKDDAELALATDAAETNTSTPTQGKATATTAKKESFVAGLFPLGGDGQLLFVYLILIIVGLASMVVYLLATRRKI